MPKTENIERRIMPAEDIELRVGEGGVSLITGYAAKFNKWSVDLGGFTERIKKGAFDEALKISDVRALKNHDPNLLLGRLSAGTLRLSANSAGLKFEVDPPDTNTGRDTVEEIRRKDITGCSFAFTVDADTWEYKKDGAVQRTITKVGELFDVGPVTYPAYPDTSVAARSLAAFKDDNEPEQRDTEPEEEPEEEPEVIEPNTIDAARQRDIERKYRKAGRIIDRNKLADV